MHLSPRDTKRRGVRSVGLSSTEECRAGEVGTVNALRAQGRQHGVGEEQGVWEKRSPGCFIKAPAFCWRNSEF